LASLGPSIRLTVFVKDSLPGMGSAETVSSKPSLKAL
jgi:hypothetical protein